jgi:hypothetical protein
MRDTKAKRNCVVPPVDNSETLLRLVWSHELDEEGFLTPPAIPTSDLKGPERGLSVNRANMAEGSALWALADRQHPKKPAEARPLLSPVEVVAVREVCDQQGRTAFIVEASPRCEAENGLPVDLSHAHISGAVRRSSVNEMRLKLMKLFGKPIPLIEQFPRELNAE